MKYYEFSHFTDDKTKIQSEVEELDQVCIANKWKEEVGFEARQCMCELNQYLSVFLFIPLKCNKI